MLMDSWLVWQVMWRGSKHGPGKALLMALLNVRAGCIAGLHGQVAAEKRLDAPCKTPLLLPKSRK